MAEPLQNEGPVERSSLVRAARVVWEMECLVRALDAMETLSSFMQLDAEYAFLSSLVAAGADSCIGRSQVVPRKNSWLRWASL